MMTTFNPDWHREFGIDRSISAIHQAYREKRFSPLDLTDWFLKQIHLSHHNAYLTVLDERARGQARQQTEQLRASGGIPSGQSLFGIPLGLKDLLTLDGVRTTCASKMLGNYVPPYTGTAVARLESAGAISLGKLNMDEFAMGSSNENSAFGPVEHPTHRGYVPGGSSGGSASAVRAGLCVAALGTDTGGSIRLPASFCGVVGLKPTYGRVSRYGMVAFASSLDQIGPLSSSVGDAARLLDVMGGHDPLDSTSSTRSLPALSANLQKPFSWAGIRVAVPEEYFQVQGMDPEVQSKIQASLQWMEKAGAKLVSVRLPRTRYAVSVYYVVAVSEASSNLARYDGVRFGPRSPEALDASNPADFYKKIRSHFGAEVKRRIILGTFTLSSGYYDAYYQRACKVRRLIQQDFEDVFKQADVIVSPVAPSTAFKIGEKSSDPLKMYLTDIFTIPVNLAGLPAMSLPCGQSSSGLPIGLHIIGAPFQEERLLSIAQAFEKGTQSGI